MHKYIILLLILLLLIFLYNKTHNIIVSYNEGVRVLQNDDGYFSRFTKNDFIARNITSIVEYKKIINKSVILPSTSKVLILQKAIRDINNTVFENDWFDNEKFHALKWKIIVVGDRKYENGYSHTRGDCIVLHKDVLVPLFLHELLMHEQLHVYQRTYKQDMKNYLAKNYIKVLTPKTVRANPDTDGYTYKDMSGKIYKSEYHENPSFTNVTYYPINKAKYEHPYELLAYDSSKKYFGF